MKNILGTARRTLKTLYDPVRATAARVQSITPRPPRFTGAYPTYKKAVAGIRSSSLSGYDNEAVAEVSLEAMTQIFNWDYPVLFWLDRVLGENTHLLDAGGHVGTKFTAFGRLLDLSTVRWTVYDLPAIVRVGRRRQASDDTLSALQFVDSLSDIDAVDILLASGLLQYLDKSFGTLLSELPNRPDHILINKVATRTGETVVTLEQIGAAQVPYQIRDRNALEDSFVALGYEIADTWAIPALSHKIATHPQLGASESRGYFLRRIT